MNASNRTCIECGTETTTIQMIDRGQQNIHYEMVYAAKESKRKFGKGHDVAGKVAAELCQNCGRITLRAVPND